MRKSQKRIDLVLQNFELEVCNVHTCMYVQYLVMKQCKMMTPMKLYVLCNFKALRKSSILFFIFIYLCTYLELV